MATPSRISFTPGGGGKGGDGHGAGPRILPYPGSPRPALTCTATTPDGRFTAIMRAWRPGDVARCQLCPSGRCVARGDTCLLMVPGRVRPEDAAAFDARGLDWPGG